MQEKLNQNFVGRSSKLQSTFPYLHQVFSNETQKNINWSCSPFSNQKKNSHMHIIAGQIDFETLDESLATIGYEYYRLSCLSELDERSSRKMLLILTLAEIDTTLSHLISSIDAFLVGENQLEDLTDSSFNIIVDNSTV
ncbi:MAG: hypothetical protein IGS39_24780 [Calothrix sp. C42_A2020_038]|nr:hypothetical protein [Calothrix sp. C42_A2020_038]